MAYERHNQTSVIVVPNHQFTNFRAANPPVTFVPRQPFGVINPCFGSVVPQLVPVNPSVVVPVRFALNPAVLDRMEEARSMSLLQFMANEGLTPSSEEEIKRKNAIDTLKQIVTNWVKRVAYQRRLPKHHITSASATILTYGSYGLGVHNSGSDIDALCVGPCFATMTDDFFIVLRNILKSRPEVTEIHCVKDAKVPLMRFKFNGISIDLPYAQLKVKSVPENVDILNPFFLKNIDETSWKSLSGVRANKSILQLVPNLEVFQSLLRCVKFWAKRRGVYGNLLGFFGGVHLAVLAAFICQRHPNSSLNALISSFFGTFAFWPWPTPVNLQDGVLPVTKNATETRSLMPIRLPCSPHEYCHSNITRSTYQRIRTEVLRGHTMTKDILRPDFDWANLFEPFPYSKKYTRFVKICLLASDRDELGDWVGWAKSRFRCLLVKLEELQGFCDPNPTEYTDVDVGEPNAVFYWGLQPGGNNFLDVDYVEEDFLNNISNGYQGPPGRIGLSVVPAAQLPKDARYDTGSSKGTKARWRILDSNHQGVPLYSKHLPHYFIGYAAMDDNSDYPSYGG
ncbi:nuclear poly(A) polymerase 3 [Cornus florida]|uniref:nuclear poly(A) polymerase 3 n=1 Tax=Cornus florida TaxID=4283 RepID=UPI002896A4A9|nr:nuclear poly(A) polymerase 3 [Cornus florida]